MPVQKSPAQQKEDTLTVFLTERLKLEGFDAANQSPLRGQGRGWADIRIKMPGYSIILEAKHGQSGSHRQAALRDCYARLDSGHCAVAIALCYPEHAADHKEFLKSSIDYAVIDADSREARWDSCAPAELGRVIQALPAQLGNADEAAAELRGELDKVLDQLSVRQKEELARELDLPTTPQPKRGGQKPEIHAKALKHWAKTKYDTAAIRACLVVASAMMFHARLDFELTDADRPAYDARYNDAADAAAAPYAGPWPLPRLSACWERDDIVTALTSAWETILALDYKPIFQTAMAALKAPADNRQWRDSLRIIAQAAQNLVNDLAGGRQDVMGRIFHRVLDTAPYDGSYYTSTAGATLLATLSIRPEDRDWGRLESIKEMNVTDPACGTGTLPIAAAARIRELAAGVDEKELSQILVENVLHLYDVNLTATHIAATTLGLMSPSTHFKNMNVHRTRLGPPVTDAKTKADLLPAQVGSLEWLDRTATLVKWPEYKISEQIETKTETAPKLAPADLFIMNPPFTRDSLRFDQFTEAEEKSIKEREATLLRETFAHRSNAAGGFIELAMRHSKEKRGRIAIILPIVGAQNKSGLAARKEIGTRMHLEYVIALKDPQNMAFSENTDIGEMMIVAKHWPTGDAQEKENASTVFVKLLRKPETPIRAKALAEAILRGESRDDYQLDYWPQEKVEQGDWFPTQFVRGELVEFFRSIKEGQWFPVASGLAAGKQGPAGQGIRGAFVKSKTSTTRRALWYHKSNIQRTMESKPDSYITPQDDKDHLADNYWEQRGRVMLPTRLRTPITRVTSVLSCEPTVGSAFVPYHPEVGKRAKESIEKATVAYLNSTVGITGMLGVTSNKIIVYPNWSVDDWYQMPFPDWGQLTAGQIRSLVAAYNRLRKQGFEEMRGMLKCQTRRKLDRAVARALRIPWEEMNKARVALASEPAITGRTFTGDALRGGLR